MTTLSLTAATSATPSTLSTFWASLPGAADLVEMVPALSAAIVMVVTLNGLF